ncbi:cell division protein FtsX [Phenylobacterium immobile]|uniref:cell division protein FtsX n=1 Tax=Phenylobacterium immobile TaxID=21 RepID=UPI000B093B65|nr:FtsX-like permease family protein [Phenylobacterium immobile]
MSGPDFAARWKPAPFLPQGEGRDLGLTFAMATLCFLACLTALAVLAGDRAARNWNGQLGAEATVIVRAAGGESPDSAAARAAEALAGAKGVSEARALEPKVAYDLIRPWLGDIADIENLPAPRLVAVTLDRDTPADAQTLRAALASQGLDAVVDDHSVWIEDIRRAAGAVRWTAIAILVLITAAAGAVIAFAARAGLATRRDVVEVLKLSGASPGFIARLFVGRYAGLAAVAGAIGAVGAAVVGALARLAGGGAGLTPALPVAWIDLAALLPCPLLAAMVAALAARAAAARMIRESA